MTALVFGFNQYIDVTFVSPSKSGKTEIYQVINKHSGDQIAIIDWYAKWRQYALRTHAGTIWNSGCLNALQSFLDLLNREHHKIGRNSDT